MMITLLFYLHAHTIPVQHRYKAATDTRKWNMFHMGAYVGLYLKHPEIKKLDNFNLNIYKKNNPDSFVV